MFGVFGCEGVTEIPTAPSSDDGLPRPSPTPILLPTPGVTPTSVTGGYDNYGETPNDPGLLTLDADARPYIVTMNYTGDIDWYEIRVPTTAKTVYITLTDIPSKSDYDMVAYDANLRELENGRSAHSGSVSEELTVKPTGSMIYLQIYSYSGRGDATLTITTQSTQNLQLSYENILTTYYPLYPRGTSFGLLERSVETLTLERITCGPVTIGTSSSSSFGELSIGNYAHVKRDLLKAVDYVDGWAVVVFNGPVSVLDELAVTMRVTIFAPRLNLTVEAPSTMLIRGDDYLVSKTQQNVYYLSQTYGDFGRDTTNDLRISSGVVGDLGDLFSSNIFTQQVEVEWEFTRSDGTRCSGDALGEEILDFDIGNAILRGVY